MRPRACLRSLLLALVISSAALLPASQSFAAGDPVAPACKEFVYLDDEQLMLNGRPFGLKGVNFSLWIGADPDQLQNPEAYFLIPYWAYRNQGFSMPQHSWDTPQEEGCTSPSACRAMLIAEHVSRIVSLGANSVRLVGLPARFREVDGEEFDQPYFPARCLWRRAGDELVNCEMDLTDPVLRDRYFELVSEAIDILGEHGLRTILHTGHVSGLTDRGFESYIGWLGHVSQTFANNPYLLAYDPMNEPEWVYPNILDHDDSSLDDACNYLSGGRPLCKGTAQRVSKAWFDALTEHDPRHLVTIGLANPYRSTQVWDPFILWDHFTSYHMYADGLKDSDEWLEDNGSSESYDFANQIYMASLGGCGLPCPYVGEFDGANCLVAQGQPGQTGSISEGGFFYAPKSGANPCPGATLEAGGCMVGEYDPGRDVPWMTTVPTYYVEPSPAISTNHGCPQSTTFDGANCVVGQGPPGATGFISDGGFYYHRFTGDQPPCSPAHVDEGTRCRVAFIPVDGGPPFIMDKAFFYVERVTCGPRKPLHFGEIGFTTYRDGVTPDPCPFTGVWADGIGCFVTTAPVGKQGYYDEETRSFSYLDSGPCENGFDKAGKVCALHDVTAKGLALDRPLFYVEPIGGQCPPGATLDTLGCRVAEGPVGLRTPDGYLEARAFIYANGFYYHYLDREGVHCEDPAQDDNAHCYVALVPPGYTPFISSQTYLYRRACSYDGPDADAVDFLVGGTSPGWPGVDSYSRSCGFQGLHWWTLADVHHADCRETNSLFTHWEKRLPDSLDDTWLVEKAHVPFFRAGLDFTASPVEKCEKPPYFHSAPDRRTASGANYTFYGWVKDLQGVPVPNAVVRVWEYHPSLGHTFSYWTTTDHQGRYEAETRHCLSSVLASAFGYELSQEASATGYNPVDCQLPEGTYAGPNVVVRKLNLAGSVFPALPPNEPLVLNSQLLNPPSTRRVACWEDDEWVLRP